jgi:hypothetical protein
MDLVDHVLQRMGGRATTLLPFSLAPIQMERCRAPGATEEPCPHPPLRSGNFAM